MPVLQAFRTFLWGNILINNFSLRFGALFLVLSGIFTYFTRWFLAGIYSTDRQR